MNNDERLEQIRLWVDWRGQQVGVPTLAQAREHIRFLLSLIDSQKEATR